MNTGQPKPNTVTIDDVEGVIAKEEYVTLGKKTTACVLTLKSGFEVVGTSSCVDPANYDIDIGKGFARSKALDKVWELQGYMAQVCIGINKSMEEDLLKK